MLKKLAKFIFYGNYFYGFCTLSLAVEANMQQNLPLNSWYFYLLLYFGTILFYTYAYVKERDTKFINSRNQWYKANRKLVKNLQVLLLAICLFLASLLLIKYYQRLVLVTTMQLLPLAFTSIIALSYYGFPVIGAKNFNVRKTGWFKPFAVGLVWAVSVTYVPVLFSQVERNMPYSFGRINFWLFTKNFMYISTLAILFDIKDYAADHNRRIKTFVVRVGLRKTIFSIIIPLTILGFISLIVFANLEGFPLLRIVINSIPFVLLIIVALSMQRRKPIIYYLAVIDGLMLAKALCGIAASLLLQ